MPRPSYSGSVSFPSLGSGNKQSKLRVSLLSGDPFLHAASTYKRLKLLHTCVGFILSVLPLVMAVYVATSPRSPPATNPSDELSSLAFVAVAIYFAVFINYAIYLAAGVRARRGMYPFRGTDLPLLVVTWFSCVLHVTWVFTALSWREFPCLLSAFFCDSLFATLSIPYVVRALRLYLLFGRSPSVETSFSGRIFTFLMVEGRMLLFYLLCAFPFFIVSFVTTYASTDIHDDLVKPGCDPTIAFFPGERQVYWGLLSGIESVTFIFCVVLTRKVWDGFSMRKELYGGFITFLAVLLPEIYCFLTNGDKHIFGFVSLCTLTTRANVLLHMSLAMPLHNSWGITYLPRPPPAFAQPSGVTLKEIIQSPKYFKYWASFMLEFDFQELWAFYVDIDMFKEEEDLDARRKLGQEICSKYLTEEVLTGVDTSPFMQWFNVITHKMSRQELRDILLKISEELGSVVAMPPSSRASSRSRKSLAGTSSRSIPVPIQSTRSDRRLENSVARSLPQTLAHSLGDNFIVGSEGSVPVGISSTPPDYNQEHQLVLEARSARNTLATAADTAVSWNQALTASLSVSPALFDVFKDNAVKIMESWCFPKFLESPQYRDLKSLWEAEASVLHRLSRDEAMIDIAS